MTNPADPRLAEAARFYAAGALAEAHARCMALLRTDPGAAQAYALLGRIAIDTRVFDKGGDAFQRAWTLDPENAAYGAGFARCLMGLNRDAPALAAAEMALVFGPRDAETFDTLGVVFSRGGQDARAVQCFRGAVHLAPDNAGYQLNLGWAEQRAGDAARAEAAFRACLALDPRNERAVLALVNLVPQTFERNFTFPLMEAFKAVAGDADRMLRIGHALAKTFEDQDEPELALDWLLLAKGAKAAQVADLEVWQARLFAAAIAPLPADALAGDPSEVPVFLFGLPGGEPEALERLLTPHPDLAPGGETMAFVLAARRAAGAPTLELVDGPTLESAATVDLAQLGADYAAELRARAPGARHVIDRQPLNVLYAGLLYAALPNARMICVRRPPVEACLAVFRQAFAADARHMQWVYGLESVARYYLAFHRLVAHWRATLPADRFRVVDWDEVVADPVGQRAALLTWLGLPPADVAPAAMPVAVGRDWREYGPKLRPLIDTLVAGGALTARVGKG